MIRILLVEDNPTNADMLSRRLARAGLTVRCAVDGEEALALAAVERPDVVLMDVQLPGIDGLEATRRLRADPATATVRVIALTAYAMADDRARCLAAGCDEYETKPVDLPRLLTKIKGLLQDLPTSGR